MDELGERLRAIAALKDPTRRRLYEQAARRPDGISREEAARAARVSRVLAAFHLDRLVEVGLLRATYRRLGGELRPRAGRPLKLYQRSEQEVHVSLPQRRYELVARVLASAIDQPDTASTSARVASAAWDLGRQLARRPRERLAKHASTRERRRAWQQVLDDHGFEPFVEGKIVRLRNCPFHALARDHRRLICGANLQLMKGLLGALEITDLRPDLEPGPQTCCVAFHPA
jgi:predicted ArsR family transcriptional regulator